MKRGRRLVACVLLVGLLARGMGIAPGAKAETYVYQESYMRDAVKRSLAQTMGWAALFAGDDFFDKRETIETEVTLLDLYGLGIEELPDLSDFKALKWLFLDQNPIRDLSALENNPNIEAICISNTAVERLPNLPNLTELLANDVPLQDISALKACASKMQNIQLVNTLIIDDSPLYGANQLVWLFIGNETQPLSPAIYEWIAKNPNLQRLELRASRFDELDKALQGKTALQELRLLGQGEAMAESALTAIGSLTTLTSLKMAHCGLQELNFLSELRLLAALDITENEVRDLSVIAQLPSLQALGADQNRIEIIDALGNQALVVLKLNDNLISDLTPLNGQKKLQSAWLERNAIADLSPLAKVTALEELYLDGNPIDNLKPLSKMKSLKMLSVAEGRIVDVKPLAGLKNLASLTLKDNQINSVKPLAKLGALKTLDLSGNPITDPTPLAKLNALAEFNLYDAPVENVEKAKAALSCLNVGTREEYARLDDPFVFENPALQAAFVAGLTSSSISVGDQTTYRNARDCGTLTLADLHLTEMPDMSMFQKLTVLDVTGNPGLDLTQLKRLPLRGILVDTENDLAPLYEIESLEYLTMECGGRELSQADYDWIARNKNLRSVVITAKGQINLDCIGTLSSLTNLEIYGEGDGNLAPLAALKKLETLFVKGVTLSDLSALQKLPVWKCTLSQCQMSGQTLLQLAKMKKLQQLALFDMQLGDYSGLGKLSKLKGLSITRCYDFSDLSPLAKLKSLELLETWECPIIDLSPLQKLVKLEKLAIVHGDVSDLEPLRKLKKLTSLNLIGNQITTLAPIARLTALTELYLGGNPVVQGNGELAKEQAIAALWQQFPFMDITTEANLDKR